MLKSQFLILISAFVTAVLISWLFVIPQVGRVNSLSDDKNKNMLELDVVRQSQDMVKDSVKFFASLTLQERNLLDSVAPPAPDIHDLAVLINGFVVESGMLLRDINIAESPASSVEGFTLSAIPLSITMQGSYENFKIFLERVEQSLRIFDIAKIDITQESGVTGSGQFIFKVQGSAYYTK